MRQHFFLALQIKTYEEAEEHFREQKSLLQQLKAENAALQKDVAATAALKLEIADLRRQVNLPGSVS